MGPRIARAGVACLAVGALLTSCSLKVEPSAEHADARDVAGAFIPSAFRLAREGADGRGAMESIARARSTSKSVTRPLTRTRDHRAAAKIGRVEREFLRLMNVERPKWGSARLRIDGGLSKQARAHSKAMARDADIYHSKNLERKIAAYDWSEAGENVGVGYSARHVHEAFMRSETHRSNIVHPTYRSVGIGVVWRAETMYVTVVFLG